MTLTSASWNPTHHAGGIFGEIGNVFDRVIPAKLGGVVAETVAEFAKHQALIVGDSFGGNA